MSPWIPDLEAARQICGRDVRAAERLPFHEGLQTMTADALAESFAGEPSVLDPRFGRVDGAEAFRDYVSSIQTWLDSEVESVEPVALMSAPERSVEEVLARLKGGGTLSLAMVTDFDKFGRLVTVRVYQRAEP